MLYNFARQSDEGDYSVHYAADTVCTAIINSRKATKILYRKNREVNFIINGKPSIFYLISGSVSVFDDDNDLLLMEVESPFIIGLAQIFNHYACQSIRIRTNCTFWVISVEESRELFDCLGIWKEVSILLAATMNIISERYRLSSGGNVYKIIKAHLEYIWSLPGSDVSSISVIDYILKRNKISRSSVYTILRGLSDGGYIQVNRGKLLGLKKLPEDF